MPPAQNCDYENKVLAWAEGDFNSWAERMCVTGSPSTLPNQKPGRAGQTTSVLSQRCQKSERARKIMYAKVPGGECFQDRLRRKQQNYELLAWGEGYFNWKIKKTRHVCFSCRHMKNSKSIVCGTLEREAERFSEADRERGHQ